LSYTFLGGYGRGFIGMPTYGELMQENDGHTRNWNFLASESQYQMIRRLHNDNLIVPLVGDFAGPKALRSVAAYLKEHDAVVSAFYTSNVEQYLFQDDENWKQFLLQCRNTAGGSLKYVYSICPQRLAAKPPLPLIAGSDQ
jgi:hypothetical protein